MTEEVDDTTNCPVCFEIYSEDGNHVPRILPCSHSLCEACLKDSIRNGSVNCPQDRKKHRAASGVRTFPENKYILRNIRKDFEKKKNKEKFEICGQHGKDMILFCNKQKCKKSVCTLCLKEHPNHEVVDLKGKKKDMISCKIKSLRERSESRREESTVADRTVVEKCDEIVAKAQEKKEELCNTFDHRIAKINDFTKSLKALENEVNGDESVEEMETTIERIDTLSEEVKKNDEEAETCMFYDLTEVAVVPRKINGVSTTCGYIDQVAHSFLGAILQDVEKIMSLRRLSDGNIILLSKKPGQEKPVLAKYDALGEKILYECELTSRIITIAAHIVDSVGSVALIPEVKTDSTRTHKIYFRDQRNLYRHIRPGGVEVPVSEAIFILSSQIFYLAGGCLFVKDCSKDPSTEIRVTSMKDLECLEDLCYFQSNYKKTSFVCANGDLGLYCYEVKEKDLDRKMYQLKLCWKVQGRLYISGQRLDAQRVIYGEERLFVYDLGNKCVRMFDLNGVHIAVLLREGEMGIGTIRNFLWHPVSWYTWDDPTSVLLVGHGSCDEKYDISRIALNLHKCHLLRL